MTYDQILTRMGLDQSLTEVLIVIGAIMIVIGFLVVLFWQYIVAGAVIFLALTVFSHHIEPNKEVQVVEKNEMMDKRSYMDDCEALTDKSELCEDLWKERDGIVLKGAIETVMPAMTSITGEKEAFMPAVAVKLLDVENKEYKERRAVALKKPNAVIMQTTFSDHDR